MESWQLASGSVLEKSPVWWEDMKLDAGVKVETVNWTVFC